MAWTTMGNKWPLTGGTVPPQINAGPMGRRCPTLQALSPYPRLSRFHIPSICHHYVFTFHADHAFSPPAQ